MAGNIVPRSDGGSNLGTADKEFNVIYAKSFGGTIASQVVTTNSPTFTGTPTAPTAAAGTNTTQLATTAFANAAASAAASSAISTHNLASDAHSATIAAAVNTHNSSTEAHSDIRTAITTAVSTHNTATDAHSTEFAKYLPLSGGALSGDSLRRNVDNSSLSLFGGSVADAVHGAYFSAFGKDHSNAGAFSLTACNGSVVSTLMGKHDGTLTWAGKEIKSMAFPSSYKVVIASDTDIVASANGWVLGQIVGGSTSQPIEAEVRVNGNLVFGTAIIIAEKFLCPIRKGDTYKVSVDVHGTTISYANLYFVYADGEI